jgi:hypothetical protein
MAWLAGALAEPELADAVFRAVGPEEFTDPVLARLFGTLMDLQEAGHPLERETLAAALARDAEALAVLAELPEDPALAEQVRYEIAFLERRRAQREREAHIRAQIRAAGEGRPVDPRGPASPGPRSPAPADPAAWRPAADVPAGDGPGPGDGRPPARHAPEGAAADAGGLPCDEFDPAYDLPVLDGPDGTSLPPAAEAFEDEAFEDEAFEDQAFEGGAERDA